MTNSRRSTNKRPARTAKKNQPSGFFEATGRKIDETAPVQVVEEALAQTRHKLQDAQKRYGKMRRNARQRVSELRRKNLGELTDDTFDYVKRYPGRGMLTAFGIGLAIAWLLRR